MATPQSGDLDKWIRSGPCYLKMGDFWRRRNLPAACDLCRKRRIRCSAFEGGAPCESCIKRGSKCAIAGELYFSTAPPQVVYRAVLPPPPPGTSTPEEWEMEEKFLDLSLFSERLKQSGPRPSPLIWRSSDEIKPSSTPSTSNRSSKHALDEDAEVTSAFDNLFVHSPPISRRRLTTEPKPRMELYSIPPPPPNLPKAYLTFHRRTSAISSLPQLFSTAVPASIFPPAPVVPPRLPRIETNVRYLNPSSRFTASSEREHHHPPPPPSLAHLLNPLPSPPASDQSRWEPHYHFLPGDNHTRTSSGDSSMSSSSCWYSQSESESGMSVVTDGTEDEEGDWSKNKRETRRYSSASWFE